ncbi:transmembrane 4 L6 family member 18 isoform X1 [Oryx dammah]|uniref:transmembrane 4 L6 family member 18 isoform X1 n=2 Tax=Oryx dammah TaxID=59534 RepID=UPI001A9B07EE|nr:transmembrane 4 L6 family member 18 isoform X1 [Oryx dammah]
MGSRKCGSCLSSLLIPLALWSIIVNILLYFPNGQASYASSNKLTNYVWYFEGICFSGIMMLVVAAVLLVLENDNNYKCCQSENCSKKYMTLLSMIFSALGIAFSGYCLVISALGLLQGPYCRTLDGWEYAFEGTAGRSQWTSSDCLPHQSGHSAVQDSLWNLFSHHPAWNHLNKGKNVFLHQDMAIDLCLLNGLEGHIQMMSFPPPDGVCCPHWNAVLPFKIFFKAICVRIFRNVHTFLIK